MKPSGRGARSQHLGVRIQSSDRSSGNDDESFESGDAHETCPGGRRRSVLTGNPALTAGPAEDVAAATQAWAEAFSRHDLEGLLRLYDADAVFWGTSSPTLRDNPAAIRDYFKGVPTSQMTVQIGDSRVRVFGEVAVASGQYTFVDHRDGKEIPRPARFSFTYRLRGGRWFIVDHHSSAVPAGR